MGERQSFGRELPVFMAQADLAPQKILGLGVGEEDPAIPRQEKDGETGGRERWADMIRCCLMMSKEVMERASTLQMRREGFEAVPSRRFHKSRSWRSCKSQNRGRI